MFIPFRHFRSFSQNRHGTASNTSQFLLFSLKLQCLDFMLGYTSQNYIVSLYTCHLCKPIGLNSLGCWLIIMYNKQTWSRRQWPAFRTDTIIPTRSIVLAVKLEISSRFYRGTGPARRALKTIEFCDSPRAPGKLSIA